MATAPVIQYLQLDAQNDPLFDTTSTLTNVDAVAQAILTRLRLFLGEWWENLSLGLPVFQSMLGQLGSAQGLAAMSLAVQQNVEGAPYVTAVGNVAVKFESGRLSITVDATTVFGPISVSTAPAINNTGLGY